MNDKEAERMLITNQLLRYLYAYELKGFNMNHVFVGIKNRLLERGSITSGQLSVLMPFIEREKPFKSWNRLEIKEYFRLIVGNNPRRRKNEKSQGAVLQF